MKSLAKTTNELAQENAELRAKLEEAEAILRAIRGGEVDALAMGGHAYAIQGAETPYRILIESICEGAAMMAEDGAILYCNRRFAELLRNPVQILIGASLRGFVAAADQAAFDALLARGWNGCAKGELGLQSGNTSAIPVQLSFSVLNLQSARALCVVASDLTGRKCMEEELRHLNHALRTISSCNQALVHAATESELLTAICQAIVREGGYRMAWVGYAENDEEKSVRPVAHAGYEQGYLEKACITWSDTERGRGPAGIAIRTGQPATCRNVLTDPNFAPWRAEAVQLGFAATAMLPLRMNGHVFGALCIYAAEAGVFNDEEVKLLMQLAVDLAYGIAALRARKEHQQAEAELQKANTYNRSLIEASLDPLVTIGPEGKITDVNAATEAATGRSRAELIGTDFCDYFTEPSQARAAYQHAFRDGLVRDYPLELRHLNGGIMEVVYNAAVYRDACGEVIGVFAAARDITERKRAEQEIRRLNLGLEDRVRDRTLELESANRELEAFAYSVSHDLRAPLRGIHGWSHALAEDYGGKLDAQGREFLTQVCDEAERMGQLIDDLLELSRVTRVELHREMVDLSALAGEIAANLRRYEPQRQVEILIDGGLAAAGDPRLLRQVLENLFGNAWKFTRKKPDARIEFGLSAAAPSSSHHTPPAFFIRDNGAGFQMAYAKKLFAPFQRMHRLSEFPGSGIGLATVRRIIHRHGGQVWAEAKPDGGATFYFTLPQKDCKA